MPPNTKFPKNLSPDLEDLQASLQPTSPVPANAAPLTTADDVMPSMKQENPMMDDEEYFHHDMEDETGLGTEEHQHGGEEDGRYVEDQRHVARRVIRKFSSIVQASNNIWCVKDH